MKKINSFTMLELVVALLISGLVVGIGYYGLVEFNKGFDAFVKRSNQMSEFRLFEEAIHGDTRISSMITMGDRAIYFKEPGKLVFYSFDQQQITRVAGGDKSIFEVGGEIAAVHHLNEDSGIIDGLVIDIRLSKEQLRFQLNKKYTPVDLLDAENHIHE